MFDIARVDRNMHERRSKKSRCCSLEVEGGESRWPGRGFRLERAAGKKVSRKSHFAAPEGVTSQSRQQCRVSSPNPLL